MIRPSHRPELKGRLTAALRARNSYGWLERGVQEGTQLLRPRRVAQLAQGLRLDLADALAGDVERTAHFLERVLGAVADTEPHLQNLLLTRGEGAQDLASLFFQVRHDDVVDRRDDSAILDEISKM